jgi:hypothetical protein
MYRSAPPRRYGHAGSDRPGPVGVAEGLAARWWSRGPKPARPVPWPERARWPAGVGRRSRPGPHQPAAGPRSGPPPATAQTRPGRPGPPGPSAPPRPAQSASGGPGRPAAARPVAPGPIVAATVLCAWSHPRRCRSDAAFAMLGGGRPHPRLQRPDHPRPPQPLRGPPAQPGPGHRGPDQATNRPSNPRLRHQTACPGQDQPPDQTLPSPLHRPPALPTPRDPTST